MSGRQGVKFQGCAVLFSACLIRGRPFWLPIASEFVVGYRAWQSKACSLGFSQPIPATSSTAAVSLASAGRCRAGSGRSGLIAPA